MKILVKVVAACLMVSSGILVIAQTTNHSQHHPATKSKTAKSMQMDMCKQMMADKKGEMEHMKAMDDQMEGLVSKMDSATGDDKIAAMSATIKELVAQRAMMHKMMDSMDSKMMDHMMTHMKSGKMDCPMMKGMKGMMGK